MIYWKQTVIYTYIIKVLFGYLGVSQDIDDQIDSKSYILIMVFSIVTMSLLAVDATKCNLTPRQKRSLDNDDKSMRYLDRLHETAEKKLRDIKSDMVHEMNDKKFLLKNLNKLNNIMGTSFTVKDVGRRSISAKRNRLLEHMYHIFKNPELVDKMDKVYSIKERYHKVLDPLNEELDNFYKSRLNNTNALYRGTSTEELDYMLKSGKIGVINYDFVCLTSSKKISQTFMRAVNASKTPIILEFKKDSIKNSIQSPGYEISRWGDSDEIGDKQGSCFMSEEEHRLPNNKINVKNVTIKIHTRLKSVDKIKEFTKKYGSLGKIIHK